MIRLVSAALLAALPLTAETPPAPEQASNESPAAEQATPPAPAAAATTDKKAGLSQAYRGIVKIEVANLSPNYGTPWQVGNYGRGNGTGFMLAPGLFMTNAHVIANAQRIYVVPYADSRQIPARVKYVAHDADLALVEIEDKDAFRDVPCLAFAEGLPQLEDEVRAIGYPIGGKRLSVTRGIVSRIDSISYSHNRSHSHLSLQIDAAINPGNSGGPVLLGDKVIGVAFQGLQDANSTGYVIPIPVIRRFLADIRDGHYDAYVELGAKFFPLINPAMRRRYSLPNDGRGALVGDIVQGSSADGALQTGDVVMAVNGHPVDSSGMIHLDGERVKLEELVERAFKNDMLEFLLLREGQELQISVCLQAPKAKDLMALNYDCAPRYVEYGGLVFQDLSINAITARQISPVKFWTDLDDYMNRGGYKERQDIIILTQILRDECNAHVDMNDFGNQILKRVNGEEIRSMNRLAEILYPAEGQERPEYIVLEFEGGQRPFIIESKSIDAANARIREAYRIPNAVRL